MQQLATITLTEEIWKGTNRTSRNEKHKNQVQNSLNDINNHFDSGEERLCGPEYDSEELTQKRKGKGKLRKET